MSPHRLDVSDPRALRVRLDRRVTALGALRLDGSDTGVVYPATGIDALTLCDRHRAVEHIFRMAVTCGMVGEHQDGDYAVLDGEDDTGDIVADYGIRSREGFRFLYRKLNWRRVQLMLAVTQ